MNISFTTKAQRTQSRFPLQDEEEIPLCGLCVFVVIEMRSFQAAHR
jgi:hypothetical protein